MWKKTGAWFFKGIPKYELPPQRSPPTTVCATTVRELRAARPEKPIKLEIKSADSSSDEDDDDNDDDDEKDAATQEYDLLKEDTPKKFSSKKRDVNYKKKITEK